MDLLTSDLLILEIKNILYSRDTELKNYTMFHDLTTACGSNGNVTIVSNPDEFNYNFNEFIAKNIIKYYFENINHKGCDNKFPDKFIIEYIDNLKNFNFKQRDFTYIKKFNKSAFGYLINREGMGNNEYLFINNLDKYIFIEFYFS